MDEVSARREPRYRQVARDLRRAIEGGRYTVGSLMPTESELCQEYSISRYTVREALRILEGEGFVSRRQGSGTFVEAVRRPKTYSHAWNSIEELMQYAKDTKYRPERVELRPITEEEARMLGAEPGEEWLFVTGPRFEADDKRPICITDVFIDRSFAEVADEVWELDHAIYDLIEDRFDAVAAHLNQEIQAVELAADDAARLGIEPGTAALSLTRRYLSADGELILTSISRHPGQRFIYAVELRREG